MSCVCFPRPRTSKPKAKLVGTRSRRCHRKRAELDCSCPGSRGGPGGNSELQRREMEAVAGGPFQLRLGQLREKKEKEKSKNFPRPAEGGQCNRPCRKSGRDSLRLHQDGRVVKALDLRSNGHMSAWVRTPLLVGTSFPFFLLLNTVYIFELSISPSTPGLGLKNPVSASQ